MEQQRPPRHQTGPRRPRRQARQGQEGLPPRLPEPLPRRHRRLPLRPSRGPAEREREATRGGAADPGAWGVHRGGAAGWGQPVRVPGGLPAPRSFEDQPHHRVEAPEGQGEPSRRADGEGPHRRGGPRVDEGHLQAAAGGGGGLQRQGEEQAGVSAADVAGAG